METKIKLYGEAEHFINETFYKESYDNRSTLDIVKLMHDKLVNDNKEKDPDYYNHREGVIHATSITKCLRGVIYEMLGAKKDNEIDPRKLGVFQAGNLFEEYVVDSLGDKIIERQREYTYKYKNIILVGRSDFVLNDNGINRIGECKSVHSDSFFYRQREGTLIAWHNQIQLQIYMWLERILFGNNWDANLIYISKDDCTVSHCAIKFNQRIIDEVVIPALDYLNEAFEKKDPTVCPVPPTVVYSEARSQWQKNWLATYCDFHSQCSSPNWLLEAGDEVARKNKEQKAGLSLEQTVHLVKKVKPEIKPVK